GENMRMTSSKPVSVGVREWCEPLEPRRLMSGSIAEDRAIAAMAISPAAVMATLTATAPSAPVVSTAAIGTTAIRVSWASPVAGVGSAVSKYRVTYTAGAYIPGTAGATHSIDLASTARSVTLTTLSPFTMYSIDVSAIDALGHKTSTHVNPW